MVETLCPKMFILTIIIYPYSHTISKSKININHRPRDLNPALIRFKSINAR